MTRKGSAKPQPGRCGARLRGPDAGRFCTDELVEGRTRCRTHGGLSLRAAAHPRSSHGMRTKTTGVLDASPYSPAERRLLDRWRRDAEDAVRVGIGELGVWRERALQKGNIAAAVSISTALATNARALVALREVPQMERTLPTFVEAFEGKELADFQRDLEVIKREAEIPSAAVRR